MCVVAVSARLSLAGDLRAFLDPAPVPVTPPRPVPIVNPVSASNCVVAVSEVEPEKTISRRFGPETVTAGVF